MDEFTFEDEDGEEHVCPTKWAICDSCRGEGKSSAYLGAFTSSEWADEDQDFQEDYMAGRYDRTCEECHGSGKVKVAAPEELDEDERKLWEEHAREMAAMRAMEASERRMGA